MCANVSAQSAVTCEPAAPVKAALDNLPEYRQDPALTDWQVYQQRIAALDLLLSRYPNDVFIQQRNFESAASMRGTDQVSLDRKRKLLTEYKARHEQNPDDPQAAYLYGFTLVGRDTPQAIKLFTAALQKDPNFILPHLSLAAIYSTPVFHDREKGIAHVKAFLDSCPADLEGYKTLALVGDKELMRAYAGKLRRGLDKQTDAVLVSGFRTLWAIEFQAEAALEFENLRKQVSRDLTRLRQLNLEGSREWYSTLEDGYKLVGDKKQADWAQEQRETHFPPAGYVRAREDWIKVHPWPDSGTPAAQARAFYTDLLAQSGQWLKEGSLGALGSFSVSMDRLRAMSHLDDVPGPDVELAVEQMLKFAGENGGGGPWSEDDSYAAEILSRKHLAPQRVVELAQNALAILNIQPVQAPSDLFATKENADDNKFYHDYTRFYVVRYEIRGYLQLKQPDQAEPPLSAMEQSLPDFKNLAGDTDARKQVYASALVDYWNFRGQQAELRGRKLDAMGFYENGLLARLDAQIKPSTDQKDELAESAHRLWLMLDGTENAWQLWYGRRANDLANRTIFALEKANQPLPAFELTDLTNKTWNLDSLKGKVTFVSFWASWCGPCREELPHLKKLIDHYKNRSDVQFITMNMDDNPGLIQPFLREHDLSLVVIPASSYMSDTLNVNGIPQNWIADERAVVRRKSEGYDPSENWITGMESAIEEVKRAPASIPPAGASK
jgi:thiol-disulfide isomerase/thioredoxin